MRIVGGIFLLSGIVAACGYGLHRYTRRQEEEARKRESAEAERTRALDECLAGVWSEDRDLIPDVRQGLEGPAVMASQTSSGREIQVPLTPTAQRSAWSIASYMAVEGHTKDREKAIRTMLSQFVAPGCSWEDGWQPYKADPRFRDVYESTGRFLDLAELSAKYPPRSPTAGAGALTSPGWVHEPPAPAADIRAGDYVEVLVSEYSDDPADEGKRSEWAWVRVEKVPDELAPVSGSITTEKPPGVPAHPLKHTKFHGYAHGTRVSVPRPFIFSIVQGK